MNEKELNQLLEIEEDNNLTFDKILRKKMNKKIYIRSMITVIVVCLVIVCGYFGTSYIVDLINYNPNSETGIIQSNDEYAVDNDFELLMKTYIEMTFAGQSYVSSYSYDKPSIQSLGFGKYTINAKIHNHFDPLYMDGQSNMTLTISRSKLVDIKISDNHLLNYVINEFKDPQCKGFQAVTTLQDIQKELNNLPDSTILDVSISFKDYQTLNQIIAFKNKYPQTTFTWLALKNQDSASVQGISGGMSLYDNTLYSLTNEANQKYPSFYLENDYTAENLQQNYLSRLQLLIDHPDFIKLLSTYDNDISQEILQDKYNKAKKEMKGYGLRICTNKKDLLSMIENDNISYIYINNLKLSQYQR